MTHPEATDKQHPPYPRRRVLGSLGNVDHLTAEQIDRLIRSLAAFASPETQATLAHEGVEVLTTRRYGAVVAIRRLWEELGLPQLLPQGEEPFAVEEAIFRLVAKRLIEPRSQLSAVERQRDVKWPHGGAFAYHQFLRAMDALLPEKERLEVKLFARLRNLFSVPPHLMWYDLTSTYFEGRGACCEFQKL